MKVQTTPRGGANYFSPFSLRIYDFREGNRLMKWREILVYVTWLFIKRVQKLFEKEEAMHFFLCLKEKSSKKEANERAARPLADKST